jgi:hypothetical protein
MQRAAAGAIMVGPPLTVDGAIPFDDVGLRTAAVAPRFRSIGERVLDVVDPAMRRFHEPDRKLKFLILDDDTDHAQRIGRWLHEAYPGAEFVISKDVEGAAKLVSSAAAAEHSGNGKAFDVVITDVLFEGKDKTGFDFVNEVGQEMAAKPTEGLFPATVVTTSSVYAHDIFKAQNEMIQFCQERLNAGDPNIRTDEINRLCRHHEMAAARTTVEPPINFHSKTTGSADVSFLALTWMIDKSLECKQKGGADAARVTVDYLRESGLKVIDKEPSMLIAHLFAQNARNLAVGVQELLQGLGLDAKQNKHPFFESRWWKTHESSLRKSLEILGPLSYHDVAGWTPKDTAAKMHPLAALPRYLEAPETAEVQDYMSGAEGKAFKIAHERWRELEVAHRRMDSLYRSLKDRLKGDVEMKEFLEMTLKSVGSGPRSWMDDIIMPAGNENTLIAIAAAIRYYAKKGEGQFNVVVENDKPILDDDARKRLGRPSCGKISIYLDWSNDVKPGNDPDDLLFLATLPGIRKEGADFGFENDNGIENFVFYVPALRLKEGERKVTIDQTGPEDTPDDIIVTTEGRFPVFEGVGPEGKVTLIGKSPKQLGEFKGPAALFHLREADGDRWLLAFGSDMHADASCAIRQYLGHKGKMGTYIDMKMGYPPTNDDFTKLLGGLGQLRGDGVVGFETL